MENSLSYKLIRSRRRSVALVVARDATLVVRAPLRMPIRFIESFLEERRDWVDRTVARVRKESVHVSKRQYVDGELFRFLGVEYPLRIVGSASRPLLFESGEFRLFQHSRHRARALFAAWYRREAKLIFEERTALLSNQHGLRPGRIAIKDMRSRWGSCGLDGSLNFNMRLVMAPISVVDYVVAHELAHLLHRDHSRVFWNMVAMIHPNYRQDRRFLSKDGYLLEF